MKWPKANIIKRMPDILRFNSIFYENKGGDKRRDLYYLTDLQASVFKCPLLGRGCNKMKKSNIVRQKIWYVSQVFRYYDLTCGF
jgi:hypothetical protein